MSNVFFLFYFFIFYFNIKKKKSLSPQNNGLNVCSRPVNSKSIQKLDMSTGRYEEVDVENRGHDICLFMCT